MKILAIESSCDETSASVIENQVVLSNIISSQLEHGKFGGVIPELASRSHLKAISNVVSEALSLAKVRMSDIQALAVTNQPGLIGSLIVGSNFAKGLSIKYGLPVIPVNHIDGHLYSGFLRDLNLKFPFISLVVSGGHTILFKVNSFNNYQILGNTVDDAAGEAFDKTAKLLGFNYPGGPIIDKVSKNGNPAKYNFPRSMIKSTDYNFSFSGLKTSVRYFLAREYPGEIPETNLPDLAASIQEAIVDVLIHKSIKAMIEFNIGTLVIAGGVSANSRLRSKLLEKSQKHGFLIITPDLEYCMDNAAMIGFIAEKKLLDAGASQFYNLTFKVSPNFL